MSEFASSAARSRRSTPIDADYVIDAVDLPIELRRAIDAMDGQPAAVAVGIAAGGRAHLAVGPLESDLAFRPGFAYLAEISPFGERISHKVGGSARMVCLSGGKAFEEIGSLLPLIGELESVCIGGAFLAAPVENSRWVAIQGPTAGDILHVEDRQVVALGDYNARYALAATPKGLALVNSGRRQTMMIVFPRPTAPIFDPLVDVRLPKLSLQIEAAAEIPYPVRTVSRALWEDKSLGEKPPRSWFHLVGGVDIAGRRFMTLVELSSPNSGISPNIHVIETVSAPSMAILDVVDSQVFATRDLATGMVRPLSISDLGIRSSIIRDHLAVF